MSLQTCYEALGGSYDAVRQRLPSDRMVQKFVLKFLNEGSYDDLVRAIEAKDAETAFRAAHTIKGVCLNLSFDKLHDSSDALCEALRHGWTDEAPKLLEPVREDYERTIAAIRAFAAETGA